MDHDQIMEIINKITLAVFGVLLSIISFFLIQTYNKIVETNVLVNELKVAITKLEMRSENYVTKIEMIQYLEEHYKK